MPEGNPKIGLLWPSSRFLSGLNEFFHEWLVPLPPLKNNDTVREPTPDELSRYSGMDRATNPLQLNQ